jgi:hypothetical protein
MRVFLARVGGVENSASVLGVAQQRKAARSPVAIRVVSPQPFKMDHAEKALASVSIPPVST